MHQMLLLSKRKMAAFLLQVHMFLGVLILHAEMHIDTVFRVPRATANQDDPSKSMTISALGRSFTLGALYNARTDQLVSPGVTLWDLDTLKKNLHTEDHPYSKVVFSAGNSMDKKASLFDINAELKMSFLAGLVKVKGAAKYLNKKLSSNYMAEVSLLYKTTTHFEQLTMAHLAADKIEHPLVLGNEKEATHIVTKIVYGANAVLSFKKEVSNRHQVEDVHGQLNAAVKWVTGSISGSATVDLTDEQKKNYTRFTVDFEGDVRPKKPPTTFFDAVKTCKTLPSLINKTTAIPIEVHLIRLSQLDKKNSRLVRRISAHLLRKTEKRLEKYDKISRNIGDLRTSPAYRSLLSFNDHVNEFQSALDVHRIQLQRKLLHILPKIRGRGLEEIELTKVLDESKSSFTMNKLNQWTVFKKREAQTLASLLLIDPKIICTEPGCFDKLLGDFNIHFVLVLKLKLYANSDPYTECLADRCNATIKYNSWLTRKLRKQMRKASVQYNQIYSLNKKFQPNATTAFAIVEELLRDALPHVSIQIFENGEEMESNFQIPSISITSTDVIKCQETRISWETTENNTEKWLMNKYQLGYRQGVTPRTWSTCSTSKCTIFLIPEFEVLLLAVCKFGICAQKKFTVRDSKNQCKACESQPCMNQGECINEHNTYRCTCPKEFIGRNCELYNSKDCADIKEQHPESTSGTYNIQSLGGLSFSLYCDMETLGGGWTVFQRRMNGEENFRRNWADYKQGFGNVAKEHWLGNDAIHNLTYYMDSTVELLVELQERGRSCVLNARYSYFYIGGEKENYKLFLGNFTGGSAGEDLPEYRLLYHNGMEFSTIDRNNDKDPRSCAKMGDGGWWYRSCYGVNLNGLYSTSTCVESYSYIGWYCAHGWFYSFPWTEMKMRKTDFKLGNKYNNWCTQVSCHIKCKDDPKCP